jgi:hypothetical protein
VTMAQAQQAEKKYRERLKKWTTQKNAPKRWKAMTKIIGMLYFLV